MINSKVFPELPSRQSNTEKHGFYGSLLLKHESKLIRRDNFFLSEDFSHMSCTTIACHGEDYLQKQLSHSKCTGVVGTPHNL
jgi:hypothetical protein